MAFRVVKQLYPNPQAGDPEWAARNDPIWATRPFYVASSSDMQLWQFSTEAEAIAKMNELTGSDSTDRKYRVDEI